MTLWIAVVAAYLLGCIPFGVIVARAYGVDLRSQGSRNIGATNALRVIGKKAGALTLAGDMLKGVAGVMLAINLAGRDAGYYAAAAGVLGHDFPVFTGFRGGKGVATSYGALIALYPLVALGGLATWLLTMAVTRISSLSALAGFIVVPVIASIVRPDDRLLIGVCFFLTVMIFLKHHQNIRRLLKGDEPRIGRNTTVNT